MLAVRSTSTGNRQGHAFFHMRRLFLLLKPLRLHQGGKYLTGCERAVRRQEKSSSDLVRAALACSNVVAHFGREYAANDNPSRPLWTAQFLDVPDLVNGRVNMDLSCNPGAIMMARIWRHVHLY